MKLFVTEATLWVSSAVEELYSFWTGTPQTSTSTARSSRSD